MLVTDNKANARINLVIYSSNILSSIKIKKYSILENINIKKSKFKENILKEIPLLFTDKKPLKLTTGIQTVWTHLALFE